MSTPFDIEAVDMLYNIGVRNKGGPCEINNYQL